MYPIYVELCITYMLVFILYNSSVYNIQDTYQLIVEYFPDNIRSIPLSAFESRGLVVLSRIGLDIMM